MSTSHAVDDKVLASHGRGAGEGGIVGMSWKQFAEAVARNEAAEKPPWRHYMQATLLWGRGKRCTENCKDEDTESKKIKPCSETFEVARVGSTLAKDLKSLDFEWLEKACKTAGCEGLTETNLWAGASGGATPLHYDATSNFLCQLCGRKRLLLFMPSQSAKLYMYPTNHPAYAFSMVDVEKPDLKRFPSFANVKGLECILEPGECLWMPSYVWHYVKQFEGDETLSLNFWVGGKRDVRADRVLAAETSGTVPSDAAVARAAKAQAAAAASGDAGGNGRLALADDALMDSGDDGGLLGMMVMRHVEKENTENVFGGDNKQAGKFLTALSIGAETFWPADSPGANLAKMVRQHLVTMLGEGEGGGGAARPRARWPHGSGLAPPLGEGVVGTAKVPFSPHQELVNWMKSGTSDREQRELRRQMLVAGR